jgi:DNA invertase Pin-like site-specific DNA recombinase
MDLSFLGTFDRVYTYERVSSQTQMDRNTIEVQHNRLKGITPRPHQMFGEVKGGDDSERAKYKELIAQVKHDVLTDQLRVLVVVTDQSRLSREGVDTVTSLIELFDVLGVVLYALDGGLLTVVDPTQRLAVGTKALFHDFFLREHRQRLRSGKAQRRLEGKPLNPNPPLGYEWTRDKYVPSEHFELARQLAVHYLPQTENPETSGDGWSLRRCSQWLGEQGLKYTPHGVAKLLRNPVWRGHLFMSEHGNSREAQKRERDTRKAEKAQGLKPTPQSPKPQVCFYNAHEAILSEEEYQRITWRLMDNQENARRGSNAPRYPLSGLVWCGYCETKLTVHNHTDRRYGRRYMRYICRNRECQRQSVSLLILEAKLKETLVAYAPTIAEMVARPIEETVNPEIRSLEQQVQDLKAMYKKTPLAGLRQAIEEMELQLQKLRKAPQKAPLNSLMELIQVFNDPLAWELMSDLEKRQVYHELVDRIVVKGKHDIVITLLV